MAFNIGQDTGYTAGTGGPTAATTSIMQKLQEELKKKQAALLAQQSAAAKAAQAAKANAQIGKTPTKSYLERLNFDTQAPQRAMIEKSVQNNKQWIGAGAGDPNPAYLDMYNNWNSAGVNPGVKPPFYPYRDSHGKMPFNLSGDPQLPWGSSNATRDYEYDPNDPNRWGYMITDYPNADLRPEQVRGWTPPDILPLPDGSGAGAGTGGGMWDYPVYNYGGGGGAKKINEWYANMVQWNINRPKGG